MHASGAPASRRAQFEAKRALVLHELEVDPAKLRAAVDSALAVRDALRASPEEVPAEEFEHLAKLLGRTRAETGTGFALKAVVTKYMGLHKTDKKAWEACGATMGAFKDWKRDFKRFMEAWEAGWKSDAIAIDPLCLQLIPTQPVAEADADPSLALVDTGASTSTDPGIPIQLVAAGGAGSSLPLVGPGLTPRTDPGLPTPPVAEGDADSPLALISPLATATPTLQPSSAGLLHLGFPGLEESYDRCKYPGWDLPRRIKDADSGVMYSYCGLTHARKFRSERGLAPPRHPVCKHPRCEKPVWEEGGRVYDFCGRSHARDMGAAADSPDEAG